VPLAGSTRRFSAAACHPGRHHQAALTIEVFPGASHRIQVGASAGPAPGYLAILARWIKPAPQAPEHALQAGEHTGG
jgi:hypothetical protein